MRRNTRRAGCLGRRFSVDPGAAAPLEDLVAHSAETDDRITQDAAPRVTVFVCTTCRLPGLPDGDPPGRALADAVRAAPHAPGIEVKAVRCLSNCKRGLSAAIALEGGWSYVFGDLTSASAGDLLTGATLFAGSTDGLMPWRGRPDSLKRGMIARVPPLSFCEDPT